MSNLWLTEPDKAVEKFASTKPGTKNRTYSAQSIKQLQSMVRCVAVALAKRNPASTLLDASDEDIQAVVLSLSGRGPTKSQIEKALREGRQTPCAAPASLATKQRYASRLVEVFNVMVESGARSSNPAHRIYEQLKRQPTSRNAPTVLTTEAYNRYIEWTEGQPTVDWWDVRDRAIRQVFLATGITVAEALVLKPDHVSIGPTEGHFNLPQVGSIAPRLVHVLEWALPSLRRWMEVRERLVLEHDLPSDPKWKDAFFLGRNKGRSPKPDVSPMSETEIYNLVASAMEGAHLKASHQGPQTLRNSHIAILIKQRKPSSEIQLRLGLETTFSIEAINRMIADRV